MCVGDCQLDERVGVNELILGVNIALDGSSIDACPSYDLDGDGRVGVNELVVAVNNALLGCGDRPTPTPTVASQTATPTVTTTPAIGPTITFMGVLSADDSAQPPSGHDDALNADIFVRPFGSGFSIAVEARPGTARCGNPPCPVGESTFSFGGAPDLQIQVDRPLGDGSATVCDDGSSGEPPIFGGVPAVDPPQLDDPAAIADALNDFGCRFRDGTGDRSARACNATEGCVRFENGEFGCAGGAQSVMQFCGQIAAPLNFPVGDTLVTARVRDVGGNLGAPARIIVRVFP